MLKGKKYFGKIQSAFWGQGHMRGEGYRLISLIKKVTFEGESAMLLYLKGAQGIRQEGGKP